jgi:PKD repeat protein
VSRTVTVATALAASFGYSPASPITAEAVQFNDTSIGNPTSWQWNFNDGTISTIQNPNHAFATTGSYAVTLTVNNGFGSNIASHVINIVPASELKATFIYNPASPADKQAVQFTDTSSGTPTSWQWDFGDGDSSTSENPSHTYDVAGTYIATLAVHAGSYLNSTSQTIIITESNVITAASPSFADVSASLAIALPGDTIVVPEGTATWANQLVITKGINLIGAGIGKTVITSAYGAPSPENVVDGRNDLILYRPTDPASNAPFRLSGFTLDLNHRCHGLGFINLSLHPINNIRVDHNRIINGNITGQEPWRGILFMIFGTVYGVADNNEFVNGYVRYFGYDPVQPSPAWTNISFEYGTADNFYFEDNSLKSPDTMFFYGDAGGRICARHNTIDGTGTAGLYSANDMHGNQPGAWTAAMGAELYENVIENGALGVDLMDQRGGKALIYNNTINTTAGTGNVFYQIREEYDDSLNPPAIGPTGQPQHVSDSYYWNNRHNGTTLVVRGGANNTVNYGSPRGIVPTENEEFWQQGASFNGTVGVGVGPLSARPTTCTKGVAYWATDERRLYLASATNTWTLYYTPYTYPHPLRNY